MPTDIGWICGFRSKSTEFLPDTQTLILEADPIPVLTHAVNLSLKCAMSIFIGTRRYIFLLSISILIPQLAFAAGQNRQKGVTVSYESLGSARIARFKNSNSYQVRVEFSYQGTRVHGSGEASGSDAVFVPANFSATYGGQGLSVTSVRITKVMRMD